MSARGFRRAREREAERAERRRRRLAARATLAAGASLGAAVLFAPGAEAANFEVTSLADGGAGSLRDAVTQANANYGNDTISFQTGLTGTITLTSGEIVIDDNSGYNIEILGPGADIITVSGDADSDGLHDLGDQFVEGDSRIFRLAGYQDVAISGLTLSGGVASDTDYTPAYTGPYGTYGPYGPYFVEQHGGAIVSYGSDLTISDTTITGNLASHDGGGVFSNQELTVNNSEFVGNQAYDDGGGATATDGVDITGTTFSTNLAGGNPILPEYDTTPKGGGLTADGSSVYVTGSTFSGNTADSLFYGIQSGYAGALTADTSFGSISDTVVDSNTAGYGTGGIEVAGEIVIEEMTITGNSLNPAANLSGDGGFTISGGVIMKDSVISGNTADIGGGGSVGSEATLQSSTVSGNTAVDEGGGLVVRQTGHVSNSTVSGNQAPAGAGLLLRRLGRLSNSTVAANSATTGAGGVYATSSSYYADQSGIIESTVIADNTSAGGEANFDVEDGELPALVNFSLIESGVPAETTTEFPGSNIFGEDPELGPLANNGGLTETHLPSVTSPLLDAGRPHGLEVDQRGSDRTVETAAEDGFAGPTDIGSVEVQDPSATGGDDLTDPDTQIDSGPSGTVETNDVSFAFSAPGETGATFECSIDGLPFVTACTSPAVFNNLSDGEHTFQVRAVDAQGNKDDTPASRTFVVDTADNTDPTTQIDSGPTGTIEFNDVSFTFSAPGETGATFECSLDGAAFAACSSPQAFTDLADGEHTFQVRAVDTSGNKDDTPASQSFTVDTSDNTPPETSIDSGPSGTVDTNDVSFSFSSPGEPTATFECSIDGAPFGACTSPQDYTDLSDGAHVFQVRAVDAEGNKDADPATQSFNVDTSDTTDPGTQIDTGPTGTVAPSAVSFTFSSPGETGATFECAIDGGAFEACTSPKAYPALADGPHVFQVRAIDTAGNADETPATRAFSVATPDTTAPATTLTTTPPAKVKAKKKKAKVTFEFTSDDSDADFECSIDGAAFAACTSPLTYKAAVGDRTFEVRAVDEAGNADATPATFAFTVKKKKKK